MAIPTFVSAGTFASGQGASTAGAPAGSQANDIWLLICEHAGADTPTAPTSQGYAAVTGLPSSTGAAGPDTQLAVWWKRVAGGETAPTQNDAGDHNSTQILAFRGCITSGDPWDIAVVSQDATSDTSGSITGGTTTVADTLVVLICTSSNDAASTTEFSGWTNADLANINDITAADNTGTAGNGGGFGVATGEKATAGAFGATAVTLVNASKKVMLALALKPPAAGGSTTTMNTIVVT